MNDYEEVEKKLKKDIDQYDDILKKTSNLVEAVPYIQRLKEDKEISLKILRGLPIDIAEELSPSLLALENKNDEAVKPILPVIQDISPLFIKTVESSSGSATPYIVNATNIAMDYQNPGLGNPDWIDFLFETVTEFIDKIQLEQELPNRLNKINTNLGEMFIKANESFVKSKNKIITVDQSAMHMRDVIQQVWGGLVAIARQKNLNQKVNVKIRLEIKTESHRRMVADVLANQFYSKTKLEELLNGASQLYYKLSDANFGKNILGNDIEKLTIYHSQWIALLDGISRYEFIK
jgi:hypothetical protein